MQTFKLAFPYTIPILCGFLVLGIAYGVLMQKSGFSILMSVCISIFVFAGSMQFVLINLLLAPFDPVSVFALTLMVNARHIFYGVSMLDKFKNTGLYKNYLIFAMCDESFSINCSLDFNDEYKDVDKSKFMFIVSVLNHSYWVIGTLIGVTLGSIITFNTKGIDFAMTALFVIILVEQWQNTKNHSPHIVAMLISIICLVIFKQTSFVIPSMICIIILVVIIINNNNKKISNN